MANVNSASDVTELRASASVTPVRVNVSLPENQSITNKVPSLPPLPPRSLFKFVPSPRLPTNVGGPALYCMSKYGEYGIRMQEWLFTTRPLSEIFIGADKRFSVEWLRISASGKVKIQFYWPGYGFFDAWTLEVNMLQKQPSGRIEMIMQGDLAITIQADEDSRGSHPLGWDAQLASISDEWRLDGGFGLNFSHVNLVSIRHVNGPVFNAHFAVLQSDIIKEYNL
ncbi:hypothetical protein JR316_0001488 [Psilocybe cubensis]|uniref:Uncharacterized protein n=2 Tax=Psilocybe cubensis TaxID=181762 RepID=A0A8H8CS60_PSICU|nr:hypothetical protein JR316_0001488 [Psilocybe cubensis]KAH9487413.1 hypothetical protein JR316_0001488 [Psilocybe cubensis]